MIEKRTPPPAVAAQAKRHPGEWLYEIVGSYGPHDAVPPEAIRGAWKVDGTRCVGLDAHAATIAVAVADEDG